MCGKVFGFGIYGKTAGNNRGLLGFSRARGMG